MTIIDRLLFYAYLRAYAICVVSLLSLYIIIDLFNNLDDFTGDTGGFGDRMLHIVNYYLYQSVQIFDRLCEAIVLLAAMFTVAWMQRSNELLPQLAAGVSTHRVIRPVLMGSALMLLVGIANQELVLPRVADELTTKRGDLEGERPLEVQGAFDRSGVHIEGLRARRRDKSANFLYVTIPETTDNRQMVHLTVAEARYIPEVPGQKRSGGWELTGVTPASIEGWTDNEVLELIDPGRYFLYTEDTDFDAVTRNRNWFALLSTNELHEMLQDPSSGRLTRVAVLFHMRLTRFPIGMVLLIMGLGLILRDQNRHMFISAGLCLMMCAVFYAVIFFCKYLGDADLIAPALAAWLPVIIFGPVAVALYDGMQT